MSVTKTIRPRKLSAINIEDFLSDIRLSRQCTDPAVVVCDLVEQYNNEICLLLDKHAPSLKTVVLRPHQPWFSNDLLQAKRARRAAEMAPRAANRGEHSYIPENFLPNCINLVIWGHEHDCQLDLFKKDAKKLIIQPGSSRIFQPGSSRIIQPGSSIATSLIFGESKQK
ncbi:Double-strand break repair protein MRE11 [Holothuria leucospilota]|uniref:Double-strand break repair protein MRE11 n=1 Tax=Holothuria leucospilota TaxID=206669 RepID=A0A9Q1BXS3_HOLLE|nr:Double-strand break repair protein MRE11 [Holothuria leucospilota]